MVTSAQNQKPDALQSLKDKTAVVARRWATTPYYGLVESLATRQWQTLIMPFLDGHNPDFSNVLDLAVGHGRMTNILLQQGGHVTAVDVLQENIDFCKAKFEGVPNLTLLRNDGVTLAGITDSSISLVFCFDSMVHFDSDVVRAYLAEFRRILKPGGLAFCHHSNWSRQPAGNFQRAAHARNFMTQALFHHYAHKEGLTLIKGQVIDWGKGNRFVPKLDCLSLARRGQ